MSDASRQEFMHGETRVSYYKVGEGKPLVVLHGLGANADVMLPLSKKLSDLRACYVLDLPGFGKSDEPPKGWSIQDYAACVINFMREKNLKNADLLVHSFGARIVLKMLGERMMDVNSVLITGGAGLKPKRSFNFYVKKYTAKTLKFPFQLLPGKLEEKGLAWLRSTNYWKKLGSGDYQKLQGVMRETFVKSVTEYLDHYMPAISNEILLLWGEDDESTPLDQARRMENGLENAALVTIAGAGHYAFLDQPGQFYAIARAFLNSEEKKSS